jgi:Helicase associated domain
MSDEHYHRLAAIGFDFTAAMNKYTFEERVAQVAAYKEMHGTTRVAAKDPDFIGLGDFVSKMRRRRAVHELTEDQIAQLDAISFDWNLRMT